MVVLGRFAVSYERGTPVLSLKLYNEELRSTQYVRQILHLKHRNPAPEAPNYCATTPETLRQKLRNQTPYTLHTLNLKPQTQTPYTMKPAHFTLQTFNPKSNPETRNPLSETH